MAPLICFQVPLIPSFFDFQTRISYWEVAVANSCGRSESASWIFATCDKLHLLHTKADRDVITPLGPWPASAGSLSCSCNQCRTRPFSLSCGILVMWPNRRSWDFSVWRRIDIWFDIESFMNFTTVHIVA